MEANLKTTISGQKPSLLPQAIMISLAPVRQAWPRVPSASGWQGRRRRLWAASPPPQARKPWSRRGFGLWVPLQTDKEPDPR
jgi:hypothetical protein